MTKNIWQNLSKPIVLITSFLLFSFPQISAQSQNAPGTRVLYKSISLDQDQCLNRGFSLLNQAESTRNVNIDSFTVYAYAGITTITIICIPENNTVVFIAAGNDDQNNSDWVNWLYSKF